MDLRSSEAETTEPDKDLSSAQSQTSAFNADDYAAYFEGSEISATEQQEFLETLWSIICHFVDLGFDGNPLDILCAQMGDKTSADSADLLDSEGTPHNNPNMSMSDPSLGLPDTKEES